LFGAAVGVIPITRGPAVGVRVIDQLGTATHLCDRDPTRGELGKGSRHVVSRRTGSQAVGDGQWRAVQTPIHRGGESTDPDQSRVDRLTLADLDDHATVSQESVALVDDDPGHVLPQQSAPLPAQPDAYASLICHQQRRPGASEHAEVGHRHDGECGGDQPIN
jgi:hypothetical protein